MNAPLIDLRSLAAKPWLQRLLQLSTTVLEPVIRLRAFNKAYAAFMAQRPTPSSFFEHALRFLRVRYLVSDADLERIPQSGPIVLVANHPYGGIDGLILGALLQQRRADGKLLVNSLLARVAPLRPHIFEVNPFGGLAAARANRMGLRNALQWLADGKALATFPAGEVSAFSFRKGRVTDAPWAVHLTRLALKANATVVPVYFKGRNSLLFQCAGLIHPRLRTLLLPAAVLANQKRTIEVRVGKPIAPSALKELESDAERTAILRLRTYILRNRNPQPASKALRLPARSAKSGAAIAPPQDPAALAAEVHDLPPSAQLATQGQFSVFCAPAAAIPRCLLEIGRLREITFRAVGEGTGKATDLDGFDSTYLHLFLWDHANARIAGAYRLGLTDQLLTKGGKSSLYTSTLFRFKPGVLSLLNPALELGRSFICADYQRKPVALSLIWRAIGEFVAQNPQYKFLFGPVSISGDYHSLSKSIIVTFLREHSFHPTLSKHVRAKRPHRSFFFGDLDRSSFKRSVRTIEEVSALISEIEQQHRGVPVLLRQYLKLNATLLAFNTDPQFANCLDGLILVDLTRSPTRTLQRYLGAEGAQRFLDFHLQQAEPQPPMVLK